MVLACIGYCELHLRIRRMIWRRGANYVYGQVNLTTLDEQSKSEKVLRIRSMAASSSHLLS